MKSYWYISWNHRKPKNRGLIKIIKYSRFIIIELSNEADKSAVDKYDLVFLGYGQFDDRAIQTNLMKNY